MTNGRYTNGPPHCFRAEKREKDKLSADSDTVPQRNERGLRPLSARALTSRAVTSLCPGSYARESVRSF
uniref:Uncharacterized protein n=1 Tax=Knipowitschia caucasica TaxID=637954 RepID=A0AAV2K7G5_KNICA